MLLALMMAEATLSLQTTMIYSVLPKLNVVFSGSEALGWIVSGKLLSSAIAAAASGPLGDLFGRRRLLCWSLALTALGGLVSGMGSTVSIVLAGALLQGASGTALPLGVALVRDHVAAAKVPMSISIVVMAATVSGAAGLVIGGLLVDHVGWASIFLFIAGFAASAMAAVILTVPTTVIGSGVGRKVRVVKGLLFAPGVAGLLMTVSKAEDWVIGDWRLLSLFGVSLAALAAWAAGQLRESDPLINLRLLADRRIAFTNLCMLVIAIGTMQHALILSMYAQQPLSTGTGLGLTAAAAGMILMPARLIGVVASPAGGWLASRMNAHITLVVGCALTVIGWTAIFLGRAHLPFLLSGMLLEASGFIIAYAAMPIILLDAAPEERSGEVLGVYTLCRSVGAALGAQLVIAVLTFDTVPGPLAKGRFPGSSAYDLCFLFILGTCIVATVFAVAIPYRRASSKLEMEASPGAGAPHARVGDIPGEDVLP